MVPPPLQPPVAALSVAPTATVPSVEGAAVAAGMPMRWDGVGTIRLTGVLTATVARTFVALTRARRYLPTSAVATVYWTAVAPSIAVQVANVVPVQRYHWVA